MQNREEAIAWLTAKGNFAFEWDTYAPNALGLATATDQQNMMSGWLLVICPVGEAWQVQGVVDIPPAPSFDPIVFDTLEQAVRSAADLVAGKH